MTSSFQSAEFFRLPVPEDRSVTKSAVDALLALAGHEEGAGLHLAIAGVETADLPATAVRLLRQALEALAAGNAVRLVAYRPEITPEEAAGILNVSYAFVLRLGREGKLTPHQAGRTVHFSLEEVLEYRARRAEDCAKALDELAAFTQEHFTRA